MNEKLNFELCDDKKSIPIKNNFLKKDNDLQDNIVFIRDISINIDLKILKGVEAQIYFIKLENIGEFRINGIFKLKSKAVECNVNKIKLKVSFPKIDEEIDLSFDIFDRKNDGILTNEMQFNGVIQDDFIFDSFDDLKDAKFIYDFSEL